MSAPAANDSMLQREAAASWCVRIADGALTSTERSELEAWLAASPDHGAYFDQAIGLWQGVEEQAADPDMIVLRAAALESLRRANRIRWTSSPNWRAFGAIAASVAVVGIALGMWRLSLPQVYETGIGERRVVVLSDGSRVSLDAKTEVSVRYADNRRSLVLEEGRARFSVAKDPLRPFTVEMDDRLVVATGTQFSVERVSGRVHVILYEGKVSVLAAQPAGATPRPILVGPDRVAADQVLRPGDELVLDVGDLTANLEPVDLARTSSWEGGQLVFADEPLARAVERVNRYTDKPIQLADAASGRVVINGVFTAGDTAAFVEGVTTAFPLRAARTAGGTRLSHDETQGDE